VYPLFCARARQVTRWTNPIGWNWMTTRFNCWQNFPSTCSWSFFARSPEKKWVHENVSFRSVYDGQLQLCMYLLCDSSVICKFSTFSFGLWIYFAQEKHEENLYFVLDTGAHIDWISDSKSCQRLIDLRYVILLFISYNYNVHRPYYSILSCGCSLLWLPKFEFARARFYILNLFHFNAVKYYS
jgi:hypothetical protein